LAKEDFTEHFVSGEEVFSGRLLKVRRDTVRMPGGAHATREYIRHPGAVAILPFTADGKVVLERQFRYPNARDFIEIPAGKVEPGEDLLETARRELLEETGYLAADWRRLTTIHNAIGYSDEAIELFAARGLEKKKQKLDEEEFLEVLEVPFSEAIAMVRDGRITDVKTIVALLWVEKVGSESTFRESQRSAAASRKSRL
jgi:ADP-ribose pyrophosphatase